MENNCEQMDRFAHELQEARGLAQTTLSRPKIEASMSCRVRQYTPGLQWQFDGALTLSLIQANHQHPHAVRIVDGTGKEIARVPLADLFAAVAWMQQGAPPAL